MNTRTKILNDNDLTKGDCVVYVMSRDQRIYDNFALGTALATSEKLRLPLIIYFNLYRTVKNRGERHYRFMIEGLEALQTELVEKNYTFIIGVGDADENLETINRLLNPVSFYFDFNPLRGPRSLAERFSSKISKPCICVDTHNVVPAWITSDKEEYQAHTFRPKLNKLIDDFIHETFELKKSKYPFRNEVRLENNFYIFKSHQDSKNWDVIIKDLDLINDNIYIGKEKSGFKFAMDKATDFVNNKIKFYAEKRNDPSQDFQSGLSPYLHYGQVHSQTVVKMLFKKLNEMGIELEFGGKKNFATSNIINSGDEKERTKLSALAFCEEILVRKELSDNFCFWNKNYDNFSGLKPWAQATLKKHEKDRRQNLYSLDDFENSMTHDIAWNAAQNQLVSSGKMHGYMRMYWAKKILEWTTNPEEAIEFAVFLNDKYSLDGYDPNGYVGILWSIGGLHDRPWFERDIYGKVRYMNYNGLLRKFKIQDYIKNWS